MVKVSVLIPAYNEEKRIVPRLASIDESFSNAFGNDYNIIVTMDGCTDGTLEKVSSYAKTSEKIIPLWFPKRLGKGGALIKSIERTKSEIIVITDSDDSILAQDLLKLIKHSVNCDMVIGSRYVKDARLIVKEPFFRFFLGRAFNSFVKLMFYELRGINDTQCGAKVVKGHVLEKIKDKLFITGFAFDVNMIYSTVKMGFSVKEVGLVWKYVGEESKVSRALLKLIIGMLFSLIKLRLYYSRLRPILETKAIRWLSAFIWSLTKA